MKHWFILILSFLGFFLAMHINRKVEKNEKLVCVIGKDCNKVIKSKYGRTLGIDNTILGMLYYAVVFVLALSAIIFPVLLSMSLFNLIFLLTVAGAAAFSLYLTIIQVFVLKELCEYCLVSALNTILIFVVYVVL